MSNLIHGAAIDQLYKCTEYLDSTVRYQDSRIEKLEQLCRDLYHAAWKHKCFAPDEDNSGNCINPEQDCEHCQWWKPAFERRMADLGLIHETEYDPDTGLKWGE